LAFSSILESAGISLLVPLLLTLADAGAKLGTEDLGVFTFYLRLVNGYPVAHRVQLIVAFLLGAIVLKNLFGYAGRLLGARLELWAVRDLRERIFERYMTSPYHFFLDRKQGRLLNDLITESVTVGEAISILVASFSNGVTFVALYTLMLLISWQATLVATGTLGILMIGLQGLSWIGRRLGYARQGIVRDFMAFGTEVILGIRQIKVFSAESRLIKKWAEFAHQISQASLRLRAVSLLPQPLGEIVPVFVMTVFIIGLTMAAFSTTEVLIPLIVTFLAVLVRLLPLVGSFNHDLIRLRVDEASVHVVVDLLAQPSTGNQRSNGRLFAGVREGFRFENVRFSYPGASDLGVLRGVSVSFPKRKTTAIVGRSGAGKSTMLDLIIRLYEPTEGRITVDRVDLQDYDVTSWRHGIGFVSQDTFIFNASIRDNIAFGFPSACEEEIIRAAQQADAHEFIQDLPQGYDTVVGDRGLKLSGGQRQRIAIARAMLRNPPILIFDEATSSLDNESEQRVQQAINRISKERTVIIVAQRLSTIVGADKIIVLDGGQVVEEGTHAELVERRGLYWRLYSTDGLVQGAKRSEEVEKDVQLATTRNMETHRP
jgi:ABC-type multidrug transport system fused ATPase/permease subunit